MVQLRTDRDPGDRAMAQSGSRSSNFFEKKRLTEGELLNVMGTPGTSLGGSVATLKS
jgi:hypothetical protein